MENLEDDAQEVTTAAPAVVAAAATTTTLTPQSSVNNQAITSTESIIYHLQQQQQQQQQQDIQTDDLDDSVVVIEPHIDVVDLTEAPTTSAGTGGSTAIALLKPKIENPSCSKDATTTLSTSSTNENPSTSGLTSSSADAAAAMSAAIGIAMGANSNTATTNQLECPICLQTCIHPARLPCGHIFCFLCVKGVAYKNRRCAMCRREIPPEFLDHPQLVNGIEDICSTKATDDGYQWFYEGRNGGWWAYDKRSAIEIEDVFQLLQQPRPEEMPVKKEEEKDENKQDMTKQETNQQQQQQQGLNNDEEQEDFENDCDNYGNDDDDDDDGDYEDSLLASQSPATLIDYNNCTYKIQICGNMYILDFVNMVQYPQDMPSRRRKICRAKGLPAKGVAGISNLLPRRQRYRRRPYDYRLNTPF